MHIQTHILSGWCIANCFRTNPRQRLFAMLAATMADVDGVGYIFRTQWYVDYHHVLTHGIAFGLPLSLILAAYSPAKIWSFLLYFGLFHLHILLDFLGSGREWHIHYFWPIITRGYCWEVGWAF